MTIYNKTRNEKVVEKHHIIKNLVMQGFGLMFRPRTDDGYVFEFKKPINISFHTSFMFFSIDIVCLDEKGVVLAVKRDVKPFRFVRCFGKYVIELAAHKANRIMKGDVLEWS